MHAAFKTSVFTVDVKRSRKDIMSSEKEISVCRNMYYSEVLLFFLLIGAESKFYKVLQVTWMSSGEYHHGNAPPNLKLLQI